MMTYIGLQSLVTLISHTVFVLLAFWALQGLKTEYWIKKYHVRQARILYVLISIALGYTVSSFFIEFVLSSQNLVQLFN